MRTSRLYFKLLGAFLLIIAIFTLIISAATSLATRKAFDLYTTRSGKQLAERLAPSLAAYYAANQSWQSVDAYLTSLLSGTAPVNPGMMGNNSGSGSGHGYGSGQGYGYGQGNGQGSGMGTMMDSDDQRLLLTDISGTVVGDTGGELVGQTLSSSDLNAGTVVSDDTAQYGYLLVTTQILSNSSPAGEFLASVNKGILTSAVVAAIIALIAGSLLFLQITSPLKKLKNAAIAISNGQLDHRIEVRSRDEFADLAQAFNQMAEALTQSKAQREQMVSDVAHELRTPLSAIQGILEGMEDRVLPMDDDQVTALQTETQILNRLVGDLRILTLADAGQLNLEKSSTDLQPFLETTIERLRLLADQKDIHLSLSAESGLPSVEIDRVRITQVIANLVSNALRYTPTGGEIQISAKRQGERQILIAVSDTGTGINPEALPYIFDRFYRADKSRARISGGSGLGLAIVKQLVEAHAGTVWGESPIHTAADGSGFGTRINFTLPIPSTIQ